MTSHSEINTKYYLHRDLPVIPIQNMYGILANVQLTDALPTLDNRILRPLLRAKISTWGELISRIESTEYYGEDFLLKRVKNFGINANARILEAIDTIKKSYEKTS